MRFGPIILATAVVAAGFILYIARPYSVISDIGYQAFSARQYVAREVSTFGAIRLVDPRDLSKDVECSLTFWTPFWTAAYALAFKIGLAPGPAGRTLAFTLSLMGALGWVWVTSLLGSEKHLAGKRGSGACGFVLSPDRLGHQRGCR